MVLVGGVGSLHLPKRPEIPERPRNTGKTSEWLNTFSGDCGEGVGRFNLIFKNVLMSIFEYSYYKKGDEPNEGD